MEDLKKETSSKIQYRTTDKEKREKIKNERKKIKSSINSPLQKKENSNLNSVFNSDPLEMNYKGIIKYNKYLKEKLKVENDKISKNIDSKRKKTGKFTIQQLILEDDFLNESNQGKINIENKEQLNKILTDN